MGVENRYSTLAFGSQYRWICGGGLRERCRHFTCDRFPSLNMYTLNIEDMICMRRTQFLSNRMTIEMLSLRERNGLTESRPTHMQSFPSELQIMGMGVQNCQLARCRT